MLALEKKNNQGFNILELLIVLVIIGVISAIGYPQFSKWRLDREVRNSAVKLKSLIQSINTQVQRGQYAFVQFHVSSSLNDDGQAILSVRSKGMKPETFGEMLNDGDSDWWKEDLKKKRCNMDDDYWDDVGDINVDILEVREIKLNDIITSMGSNLTKKPIEGAICFSRSDKWYSGADKLTSTSLSDKSTAIDNQIIVCSYKTYDNCNSDGDKNHYQIEWSRFGNVKLEKWTTKGWVTN